MEVKIIREFRDRADYSKVYPVNETFTFEDERAEYLISKGLAEKIEAESKEVETEVNTDATQQQKVEETPLFESVGKVQPIFIHEEDAKPAVAKKKRIQKDAE